MKARSFLKSYIEESLLCSVLLLCCTLSFAQPVARFSAASPAGCAPILVQFSDESTGNPNYWHWDLGNGTISYLQNPSVTYFTPGNYNVKLVVKNATGQDSVLRNAYVQVYPAPMVDFTATQTSGCDSVQSLFTERSNGATAWQWDFGDGIFSSDRNPSHTYTQPGSYNISLKAINGEGCALTLVKQAYVTVDYVRADFAQYVVDRCLPSRIYFQNNAAGTGRLSYKWFFGNGDSSVERSPYYNYPAPGNYQVRLSVSNEYGCVNIMTRNITIEKKVSAAFTADITNSCIAPAAVNFTNQSLANNTYTWSFGDTLFSSQPNPEHVYNDTGSYTVKLVVRNINGCSDSLEKTNYIQVQKPFVSFDNLPDSGCIGFTKTINVMSTGIDSVIAYKWDFGDGTFSTLAAPTHVFNGQRYFNILLITTGASGCRDTLQMQNAIHTSSKPHAAFSADRLISCAQTGIQFIDQTQGNATNWQWNFGDNGIMTEQNPLYRFSDTGHLDVELIAGNGGCADTLTKSGYVFIKPSVSKLKFDFSCDNPFQFSFTNLAIGADSWVWNFGDGNSSTELDPVHTYSDTGSYTVSLITYNYTTGCEAYKSKGVITASVEPQFYASDSIVCKGSPVTFTATADSTEVTRYSWDFGDGVVQYSLANRITHQYQQPGSYNVKLIINNRVNCRDSVIKTGYISVKEIKAKFSVADALICYNSAAVFNDSSFVSAGSTIVSWQWNYGDGNTELVSSPPFSHAYRAAGTYAADVTVTDNNGCKAFFASDIPIVVKKIIPQFFVVDSIKCTENDVRFICAYAEPGVTYYWDYGDGNTAVTQSSRPLHKYENEGEYYTKLTVSHIAGCVDSFALNRSVKIQNPVAKFAISDSFTNCPPLIVQFTNESVNAIDEVWDFGDGSSINAHNPSHFYSYPGVYIATLTVRGSGGCTNTAKRTIVVHGPKGSLRYGALNFCNAPAPVTFTALTTDATSFLWDFNDGTTINTGDSVIVHEYTNAGRYLPKLMLVDDEGCRVPVQGIDTIRLTGLKAGAGFSESNTCNNRQIVFTNTSSSSDSITSYKWYFGDGTKIENVISPSHQYERVGVYFPSLSITTINGCQDSFITSLPITVAASPDVSILSSVNSGCMPLAVSFNAASNINGVPVTDWQWNFANGNISSEQNPLSQIFSTESNYPVSLTVTGTNGCTTTIEKNIEVHPLPVIETTGNMDICKNSNTILTASGASSWLWLSADGRMSCTDCAAVTVSPQATTDYTARGTNQFGCVSFDTVTVKVAEPFSIIYNTTAKVCNGSNVLLQVTGADVYEWFPSIGLNDAHSSSPSAAPAQTTIYKVIGKNINGCYSDSGFITVTVNALPTIYAGVDKAIAQGSSVELVPELSNDITEVMWTPTGNVFRNADNSITVKPIVSTEYTAVAKNAAGCIATDKIKITVTNEDPAGSLFIPNTFSPNGDGMNDVFYPRAAAGIKINRLKIMNREGVVVFERTNFLANDLSSGWDGTLRGTKLLADVYIFAVEITGNDGKPKIIPGNISLLR